MFLPPAASWRRLKPRPVYQANQRLAQFDGHDEECMIGLLYITAGLLVEFSFVSLTGAMLGMTTPIFTISSFVITPLLLVGPSLLLLAGIAATLPNARRGILCLITGSLLVAGLAVWTVPRIGWRYAGWLILEPEAISIVIASFIVLLLKNRWISALIGAGLTAPFFVFGAGSMLYRNIFEASSFAASELTLIIPGTFVTASFVSSLCFPKI